jgi:hypothetical protein
VTVKIEFEGHRYIERRPYDGALVATHHPEHATRFDVDEARTIATELLAARPSIGEVRLMAVESTPLHAAYPTGYNEYISQAGTRVVQVKVA